MKDEKDVPKIGWIGTGIMGAPMCDHIIHSGYKVCVYNRTKEKAQTLITQGAEWVESPTELVKQSDVVFTMLGYPDDVREVYFGQNGLLKEPVSRRIFVDMTTTEPSLAKRIYQSAIELGSTSLDAPVSGGDIGAVKGELSIMVGGDESVFESLIKILNLMGNHIVYHGGAGCGQHAKMCNQITVAGVMIGICESLIYCRKVGLSVEKTLRSVGSGAASSWLLQNLAPRIARGDYAPGFLVDHFIKDMEIILSESQRTGIILPGLSLVKSLYNRASTLGHGKLGTQALLLALEDLCADTENDIGDFTR